jgi:hypothetical protein
VPKVELYAAIRRDARAGMSARAKLDPFKPAIDEMLRADLDAPRKQRHTITRIYRRLTEEHQMRDVSYPEPKGRGRAGPRVQPCPRGKRAMGRVPVAFPGRLLLPARHHGSAASSRSVELTNTRTR